VEFDVQRCASGELVVFHDRSLARCTGHVGAITETPLAVLRQLTLDRVARSRGVLPEGARIPTLDEWLSSMPAGFAVNLEVKAETAAETELAGDCVTALQQAGLADRSVVSSFHPMALLRIAGRAIDRGALVEGGRGWRTRLAAGLLSRPAAVHPDAALVTPARVRLWHGLGYRVAAWTADEPDEIRRLLDAGIDVLITNRPDVGRPLAEQYKA
jgi:glycerophosphoryl diester phosphodiesterase